MTTAASTQCGVCGTTEGAGPYKSYWWHGADGIIRCGKCAFAGVTGRFTGGGTRNCIPEPDAKDREIASLRSELARLRHALDESNAAIREANSRLETVSTGFYTALCRMDDAERIASLAMSEGLRQCEALRIGVEHLRERSETQIGPREAFHRVWMRIVEAEQIANLAMAEGLRAVEREGALADRLIAAFKTYTSGDAQAARDELRAALANYEEG